MGKNRSARLAKEVSLNRKSRGLDQILRQAKAQGVKIVWTNKGHIKMLCPNGGIVISSNTLGDARGLKNLASQLRRHGGIEVQG